MGAYNGSGTFVRTYDWTTDEGNGINIEAARMDTEDDGFATGLSTAITKDGQTTISANIPFNTKKITGLGNGSVRTDSIALGQVQDGTYTTLGTAGGAADVYTATPSPSITAYATGSRFIIKIQADNTGASTLDISAVGVKAIEKYDGAGALTALEAGDLQQDQYYDILYDGTKFVVSNPQLPHLDATNLTNIANPALSGATIQEVHTATGAVATGSTLMPLDDTIPQITEGDQYLSQAITPTNSSNKLLIEVEAILSSGFAGAIILIGALFQDSTSSAISASFEHSAAANSPVKISIRYEMVAGTTSSTTFKFRAGIAAAGVTTLNGQSAARLMGGVANSFIRITEFKV